MSILIVFAITYIIDLSAFLGICRCQGKVCVHVVNTLSVILVCQSFRYSVVWCAYQFVNHGFKHHVEALGQNIFLGISVNGDTIRVFKEGIAQIPELQGFVREVFIFDLHEPCLTHATQILLELLPCYQVILDVDRRMETILVIQIVQYAIEDNEQFFLIVDNSLLVDRIQINHIVILYKSLRVADSSRPVDFVVTPMQVLDGKQDKISILLIKRD